MATQGSRPGHSSSFFQVSSYVSDEKSPPHTHLDIGRSTSSCQRNVPGHKYENTYCSNCQNMIIERIQYHIRKIDIVEGKCKFCENPIPGVWA